MRFAGSTPAPKINYRPTSGDEVDFQPGSLKSSGVRSSASNAADAVSVGSIYGTMRDAAPKFDEIATTAMENRAAERISAASAEGQMAQAGIGAGAMIKKAEYAKEAAEAREAAAEKGGMMSAIGGIASAAFGLFSDEKTKHTIADLEEGLELIRQLRPVTYFYKPEFAVEPDRPHNGFIAQELNEVVPNAIHHHAESDMMCVDLNELVAIQVKAIQELDERVKSLEAKLALATV